MGQTWPDLLVFTLRALWVCWRSLPNYRRQGIATLLQSYLTNLELSRGHIPYGQVFDGNEPSLALQRSLGYQRSAGLMYWSEL